MTQGLELRGAVLGKGYRLGRRLDTDDTSAYEATHERIPGRFIIRIFPPESLSQAESSSRIQRGARVASLLRDPHAVQVLDCNASGEMPAFVVSERIPGRSLADVMADDGMLPLPRVTHLVESIAAALAAAHQIGLVHGDIRPTHVILPTSGEPAAKLSGFGWAKELRAVALLPSPSGYLAPEQQLGKVLTLDERTDQFGLAALAYDMLAACLPFSEESVDLSDLVGTRPPPAAIADLVPGVPAAVDEVLRRALAANPAERFSSVLELAERLRQAIGSAGVSVASSAAASRPGTARAAGLGAAPTMPSGDVTEELDLGTLPSGYEDDDDDQVDTGDEDEDLARETAIWPGKRPGVVAAATDVRGDGGDIPRGARDREAEATDRVDQNGEADVDGDDATLVLGSERPRAKADEERTQISRSPFFEEDTASDRETERSARSPFTTPRRGIPLGRPPIAVGGTGSGGMGSGRVGMAVGAHKTNPGIGPTLKAAQQEWSNWREVLGRSGWTVPLTGGAALLVALAALVWMSTGSDDPDDQAEEQMQAEPAPPAPTAAPAPVPAPAPPAPPPTPPALAQEEKPAAPIAAAPAAEDRPARVANAPLTDQKTGTAPPPAPAPRAPPARTRSVDPWQPRPVKAPAAAPATSTPRPAAVLKVSPARPLSAGVDPFAEETPPPAAGARNGDATPPAPRAPGNLDCAIRISSRPWAEIWLDGKNTGQKTPVTNMKVACGVRKLELKRPDKDIEQMEMLDVVPGKPFRGSYELE